MKRYKVELSINHEVEMVLALMKGLGRELTEQERKTIRHLADEDYVTSGVLLDLFRELAERTKS